MASLYDLTENYKSFNDYVENALDSDDLTEEDLEMFIETLDTIQDTIENKVHNTVAFLKNIKADIDTYKTEEKRLANKRKVLENTHERLKNYMFETLESVGINKISTGVHGVRIQKSNPSVQITDPNLIPEQYKIPQEPKIEKKDILKDLKNGTQIDGAELVTDKKHIVIL